MRVAIDTNGRHTTKAGTARYLRGLLGGLKAEADPAEWDFLELAWPVDNFGFEQPQRALKTAYREIVWARWVAQRELRRARPRVYHSTASPLLDPPTGIAHVVTLHDLAVLRFPERFRPWHRRTTLRGLRRLGTAARIICISQATADEALQRLSVRADRLTVVHNGCDFHDLPPSFGRPPSPLPPGEFFLFVGSLEPGKNLALLRETYRLAAAEGQRLPPLCIAGARWSGVPGEGRPPADWHYLGHVTDEELVWLYRHARALLFPSKYEGFGLPVAEAMALGCPVVCSPVASLPEVGGEAAWFTPLDPAAYLATARELMRDDAARADRIDRGRRQAARFHWRQCARETMAAYRAAI